MKRILSCLLIFVMALTIMGFVGCDTMEYRGVYTNEVCAVGINDDTYKMIYNDGSGTWGEYKITNKTDTEVEVVFTNWYRVIRGGMETEETTTRRFTGATIKKENENTVMYLHFAIPTSDWVLIKQK